MHIYELKANKIEHNSQMVDLGCKFSDVLDLHEIVMVGLVRVVPVGFVLVGALVGLEVGDGLVGVNILGFHVRGLGVIAVIVQPWVGCDSWGCLVTKSGFLKLVDFLGIFCMFEDGPVFTCGDVELSGATMMVLDNPRGVRSIIAAIWRRGSWFGKRKAHS